MARPRTHDGAGPRHVSLVALPDAVVSTLFGIFDVMNSFTLMRLSGAGARPPFQIDIVGEAAGPLTLASGVAIDVPRSIDAVETSDIVIVPSILLRPGGWAKGRYPHLVDWLQRMHERGALLCSACSGIFLLAETGLYDGKDATVHFRYARAFAARPWPTRRSTTSAGALATRIRPFSGACSSARRVLRRAHIAGVFASRSLLALAAWTAQAGRAA